MSKLILDITSLQLPEQPEFTEPICYESAGTAGEYRMGLQQPSSGIRVGCGQSGWTYTGTFYVAPATTIEEGLLDYAVGVADFGSGRQKYGLFANQTNGGANPGWTHAFNFKASPTAKAGLKPICVSRSPDYRFRLTVGSTSCTDSGWTQEFVFYAAFPNPPVLNTDVSISNPGGETTTFDSIKKIIDSLGSEGIYNEDYKNASGSNTFWGSCCGQDVCVSQNAPANLRFVYSSPLNTAGNGKISASVRSDPQSDPSLPLYLGEITGGNPNPATPVSPPLDLNSGDLVSDGNVYVVADYSCIRCEPSTGPACTDYNVDFSIFLYYTPTEQYKRRCCASKNISTTLRNLCPAGYDGTQTACVDLFNTYCGEQGAGATTDPLCGCFPAYVEANTVAQNDSLQRWLAANNQQFPVSCSSSCETAVAWFPPNLPSCDLTICTTDIDNTGGIKGNIITSQACGPGGNGGNGGPSNGNGGPSNGPTNGPDKPIDKQSWFQKNKTAVIAGSVIGGILLILLIIGAIVLFK